MKLDKFKPLFWEVLRFGLVGGICFVLDTALFLFSNRVLFSQPAENPDALFTGISTALGFFLGLIANYLLSRYFVFVTKEQKENGKGVKSFVLFVVISGIGFALTEFLVWLLCPVLGLADFWSKVIAAGAVMIWNYVGRKFFIFK